MPPLAIILATGTARVADKTLTAHPRSYSAIATGVMKRDVLVAATTAIIEHASDEHTGHLTKVSFRKVSSVVFVGPDLYQRLKSVKQLIKEKIEREIKKAIKKWIMNNLWIFGGML